jgi:hypothetical protein
MACLIVALAQSTHTIDKQKKKEKEERKYKKKYFQLPSPIFALCRRYSAELSVGSYLSTLQPSSKRVRRGAATKTRTKSESPGWKRFPSDQ